MRNELQAPRGSPTVSIGEEAPNLSLQIRTAPPSRSQRQRLSERDTQLLEYAQRIAGAQGQPDSLYWGGSAEPLVPKAFADAAVETGKAAEVKPKPYHGYYFRVLQAQGPNAEGGRHNYMVKDSMIGGFGLVAWPAHYGVSGVHTFIVNQNGVIYEKDLGNPTASLSTTVTSYDPDKSWARVQ